MKYIGLLITSLGTFLIILANFYYNFVILDMKNIKDYVSETNIILEDVNKEEINVIQNKNDYIKRLKMIKDGLNNSKTTFLLESYKKYKIKSIESLIITLDENKIQKLKLNDVKKYNELCDKEIDRLIINKSIL